MPLLGFRKKGWQLTLDLVKLIDLGRKDLPRHKPHATAITRVRLDCVRGNEARRRPGRQVDGPLPCWEVGIRSRKEHHTIPRLLREGDMQQRIPVILLVWTEIVRAQSETAIQNDPDNPH